MASILLFSVSLHSPPVEEAAVVAPVLAGRRLAEAAEVDTFAFAAGAEAEAEAEADLVQGRAVKGDIEFGIEVVHILGVIRIVAEFGQEDEEAWKEHMEEREEGIE